MARSYPSRSVRRILCQLGLKELRSGKGGHSVFVTREGKRVCPPIRKKEMPLAHIFSLAVTLEGLGIVSSKRAFIATVKQGTSSESPNDPNCKRFLRGVSCGTYQEKPL